MLHRLNATPIDAAEVIQALDACPAGSSPGPDLIPYEALKYGGMATVLALTHFCNIAWFHNVHPTQWDEALIAPLFKGGPDPHDVSRYRAITLLCTSCKVYEAVLANRTQAVLDIEGSMSYTQGGFRHGVAGAETIAALKSTLDARKAANRHTYAAFIDFETAFPRTFKPLVWCRLAEAGVQGRLWHATRSLYGEVKSRVDHPEIPEDEFFDIPQGLREGSKLSPLLFNLAVNDMSEVLTAARATPLRRVGAHLPASGASRPLLAAVWQYADDVALLADSQEELMLLLDRLDLYCYERGLTINYSKSCIMEINDSEFVPDQTYSISPRGREAQASIPIVDSFTYLGIPIARDLGSKVALAQCLSLFWATFRKVTAIGLHPHGLLLKSRVTAWKAYIWSQIDFYLPFLAHADLPRVQSAINRSLRAVFAQEASAEALCAEFGLLSVEISWADAIAKLGGRLQTNPVPLQAAAVTEYLLQSFSATTSKKYQWLHALHSSMALLGLLDHWPRIIVDALPPIVRAADIHMSDHPAQGAAEAAPFRHTWAQTVETAANALADADFRTWTNKTGHRANAYREESMSGLPDPEQRPKKHKWISLPISLRAQQNLLTLRALGSDLATHMSSRWQKEGDDYEEAHCPLCSRPSQEESEEAQESIFHMIWECPDLQTHSLAVRMAAARTVAQVGGLALADGKAVPRLQWPQLPTEVRLGLFMGNWLPCLSYSFPNKEEAKRWFATFLENTHSGMGALWKARLELINPRYTPTA